jgi:hypothetical protein
MYKILLLCLIIVSPAFSHCSHSVKRNAKRSGNESTDTGHVKIIFREYEHNFGKVPEGEKVGYVFEFENRGTADLVIASAITTCGCTVPEYDKKPVHPGGTGKLEVVFNTSGKNGMQTKTITVRSNADTPVVLLKITAEVVTGDQ